MKNSTSEYEPIPLVFSKDKKAMKEVIFLLEFFERTAKKLYYDELRKATGITKKDLKSFKRSLSFHPGRPFFKEIETSLHEYYFNFYKKRNEISCTVLDIIKKLKKLKEKAESWVIKKYTTQ